MIHQLQRAVIPVYFVLCLLLGGASAAGFPANMLLQLLALPLIGWAILARRGVPAPSSSRQLFILVLLLLLLITAQLIPMPPALWTALPGRGEIISGYRLLEFSLPWLPISVTPYLTVASALWLLPALAVLVGIVRLGAFRANWIAFALIGVTITGVALGAVQRAGNDAGYFYEITNYGMATGFFSNANHMGTLLMATVPFVAAIYLVERRRSRSAQHASGLLVILAGITGVLVVGIAINGSLAAIGLAVPVIGATGVMLLSRIRKVPSWAIVPLLVVTLLGIALIFSRPLGNNLTAGDAQTNPVSRATSFANTIHAAKDYFPTGSGIGSFNTIYPMYENSATLTTTYVNHAHSDLLEVALETGIAGMALLALFLIWWVRRAFVIWRAEEPDQFARAATIASGAILAHSLVDYPLRTAAISALFAACCALMTEPRPVASQREIERERERGARHLTAD